MEIFNWNDIAEEFEGSSIVLGNGASRAISDKFDYSNLYFEAKNEGLIDDEVVRIFKYFGTENFEYILRMLWHSYHINLALGIDRESFIHTAYNNIKTSLITTIRNNHAPYNQASLHFDSIYKFLMGFETVVSLNYDLIVYWTMMHANKKNGIGQWFKDCFWDGRFQENWEYLRKPHEDAKGATLIFYVHGNLILKEDIYRRQEVKIKRNDFTGLLDKLEDEWKDESIPIFVSEGDSDLKKMRIWKSTYLKNVFDKVLPNLGEKIVFYGWSVSDQDIHILKQIAKSRSIKKIAVSVYQDNVWPKEKDKRIREILSYNGKVELIFFDTQSEGCWIYEQMKTR